MSETKGKDKAAFTEADVKVLADRIMHMSLDEALDEFGAAKLRTLLGAAKDKSEVEGNIRAIVGQVPA